jgi:hypothetical protein
MYISHYFFLIPGLQIPSHIALSNCFSMSSAAVQAPLFDAIELVSPGSLIPTCIPTGPDGTVDLTPQWLSIRYGFDADSLWLETDVVNQETQNVLYSLYVQAVTLDNNARVWKLKPGRYRVFGLSESMNASIVLLTPHSSSTLCTEAPLLSRVKIEPGLRISIDLSDSSDDEERPSHPSIRYSAKRPSPKIHVGLLFSLYLRKLQN